MNIEMCTRLVPSPWYSGERARVRGNLSNARRLTPYLQRLAAMTYSAAIISMATICLIASSARAQTTQSSPEPTTQPTTEPSSTPAAPIPLWTGSPPNSIGNADSDIPNLLPYFPPPDRASGAAIIICQGGAYNH